MIMNCYNCKKEVSTQTEICPHCGYPVDKHIRNQAHIRLLKARQDNNKRSLFRAVGTVSFLVFFYFLYLSFVADVGLEGTLKQWGLPRFIFEREVYLPSISFISGVSALVKATAVARDEEAKASYLCAIMYFHVPFIIYWIVN